MRAYETSHPWIRFENDLGRAPAELWILLGEARSKCDHLSSVPLQPNLAKILHYLFLAKGASATTAIEGNTLTLDQVELRIKGDLELPPSQEYLGKEVDNVVEALGAIWDNVLRIEDIGEAQSLSVEEICELNRIVLKGTQYDDYVNPGEIRRSLSVGVGRYRGAPPEDCEYLLSRYCEWLNEQWSLAEAKEMGVIPSIIKAVRAHLLFEWIHPFADGNGRVGRLIEFKILVAGGVPTVAAHLFSNHYNSTRSRYYSELERAARGSDGVFGFLMYAVQGFVDQLVDQINILLFFMISIVWRDLIHGEFSGTRSRTKKRQRDLMLAISDCIEPLTLREIPLLTTDLARQYAVLTDRTLLRDLGALKKMKLLIQDDTGYHANVRFLFHHLPSRREEVSSRYLNIEKNSSLYRMMMQVRDQQQGTKRKRSIEGTNRDLD